MIDGYDGGWEVGCGQTGSWLILGKCKGLVRLKSLAGVGKDRDWGWVNGHLGSGS